MTEPIDMTGVRIDRDYGPVGCERCQDGAHWECHGCSCPCQAAPWDRDDVATWEASVNAVGPRISPGQREEQWRLRELEDIAAAVAAESVRGML